MTQKKKEDLLAALNKNLPKEIDKKNDKIDIINDTEEDYQYASEKLKNLVDQSEEAIELMMALAHDTEHPRAFEVLGNLLKGTGDITDKLLQLQKKRKELTQEESKSGNTTNNAIFMGSTTELQKFLKSKKEKVIDVDTE